MELTGKCEKDFNRYLKENFYMVFNGCPESVTLNIIVSFFDSKEVFIHLKRNCTGIKFNHWYCIITDVKGVHLNNFLKDESKEDDRNLILKLAIQKANEIYNKKKYDNYRFKQN